MFAPCAFFDLRDPDLARLFDDVPVVWEVVPRIAELVCEYTRGRRVLKGEVSPGAYVGDGPIVIEPGATVEPGAYIGGPAYIAAGAVVRHGAYLRENVLLLAGSVVGHASEAKNSLFLPEAKAPHFAYVGDSVIGHRVNIGAGTKLSNVPVHSTRDPVTRRRPSITFAYDGQVLDTGLPKLGAVLGDDVQTGCNVVTSPGTLIGQRTVVYPGLPVPKGFHPADTVMKFRPEIVRARRV